MYLTLTKMERQLLKALQKRAYKSDYCYNDLKDDLVDFPEDRFSHCCEFMEKDRNLLKMTFSPDGELFVSLTYVGYYYKEFRFQRILKFIVNTILIPIITPIIVAVLTTLFINFI